MVLFAGVVWLARISWKRLGNFFLQKFVHENFDGYIKEREEGSKRYTGVFGRTFKYFLMFFGLYLDPRKDYFIEEEVPDIDMTKIREIIKDRIIDLLSACLAVTVIIGSALRYFLVRSQLTTKEARDIFFGIAGISTLISPVLVGWLIPVIWTLQDSAIREVTKRNTVRELATNVRNGFLNRLLGFAGFIGGLTLLMDVLPLIDENGNQLSTVEVFIISLIILFLVVVVIAGPAYLTGLIYFTRNHEENVNKLRFTLFLKGIPLGMTMVRNANEEEIERFRKVGEEILRNEVAPNANEELKD